jgi:predicted nucleic-acid-binding Zn-ribbon protein
MRTNQSKKDLRLLLVIFIGLILAGLASCESKDPECYEPINVTAKSVFKIRDSIAIVDSLTKRDTILVTYRDSIMRSPAMYSIDVDSQYNLLGYNSSVLGVPLNPATDSMRYIIKTDTAAAVSDTISFYYRPVLHFISNNCGYTYYYTLDSVHLTKNALDSFSMTSTNVNNEGKTEHVMLYFFF